MNTKINFSILEENGFIAGLTNFTNNEVKINNNTSDDEECGIEFVYQDDKYLITINDSCVSSYKYVVYRARKSRLPNISKDNDSWYNRYQVICKGYFNLDLNPDTNTHLDALNDICNGIMKAYNWKHLLVDSISNLIFMSGLKGGIDFKDHSDGTITFNVYTKSENIIFKLIINKQTSLELNEAECIIYYGSNDNFTNHTAFRLWPIYPIYHDDNGKLTKESEKELLSVIKSVLPKSKGKRFNNVMKYIVKGEKITITKKWKNKMLKHFNKTGYYQFKNPLLEYYLDTILDGVILKNEGELKFVKAIKAEIKFSKYGNKCKITFKARNSNNLRLIVTICLSGASYNLVDIIVERVYNYDYQLGEGIYDTVKEFLNVKLPYVNNNDDIAWEEFKKDNKKSYMRLQRLGITVRKELTSDV